jgi:D-aminopeptidase
LLNPSESIAIDIPESRIDAIFAELDQCHGPGATVGIALHGSPVYRKGFGLAHMELPVALSPSMRMRIYSTGKHFTCLAYLLLCEEGKADIDDPIGKVLPDLNPVTHSVTMRQLMGNIGGIRDAHDICYQFSGTGHAVSSAEILSLYRDIDDVNFEPGTAWCYNNGGFALVGSVIERLTGSPLGEVLQERIFQPVGMSDTLLRPFDTDFVPNSATMHAKATGGAYTKSYLGIACAGEGGLVSTVDDMLRWLAHMDAPRVGKPSSWALMRTSQTLKGGTATGYGLGLMTGEYRGIRTIHHGGGGMGANSQMIKLLETGLDVVVMLNSDDASAIELAYRIIDVCMAEDDLSRAPRPRPFCVGTYRSPRTGRVLELFGCNGQQMISVEAWDMPFEPNDEGVFRPAGVYGMVKREVLLLGSAAEAVAVRLSDFGDLDEFLLVERSGIPDVKAILGSYCNRASGTRILIDPVKDGVRLTTVGRFGSVLYDMEWLGEQLWRSRSIGASATFLGGILSFNIDGSAFDFSNYRSRSLRFQRAM